MTVQLVVGSRQSPLALKQTEMVMTALMQQFPELSITIKPYTTQGDRILDHALSKVGDKGLFVKELETALLEGEIDFAVHSMKDMPSLIPSSLTLLPFGKREDPSDALISRDNLTLDQLPVGALIGTSSLRRQALLKARRGDLNFTVIRGNVETRLNKVRQGEVDATLLATAGLNRLGLSGVIAERIPPETMVPACCQGILGVELMNPAVEAYFLPLMHETTAVVCKAERAFLTTMEGGCQVPLAAYARALGGQQYELVGVVCALDGSQVLRESLVFHPAEAHLAGYQVAKTLLDKGARSLIDACHQPS